MIQINNSYITEDIDNILIELRKQLDLKGIKLFSKIIVSGDNIQTNCPFHNGGQERKPSFGILSKQKGNEEAGTCHCFACGWTGSFAEMVSNIFGYDDLGLYGGKWLVRNFLTVQVENRPDILEGFNDRNNISIRNNNGIHRFKQHIQSDKSSEQYSGEITEEELDKYRVYHPYMWKRKLTPEVVELFDIGYDKETECITFNCRNKQGNTLFVAKRSVTTKFFHYPNNVEKQVYGIYELYSLAKFPSEVYICESMLDALVFWTHENKYACALNGLGTKLQFKQLREMPCRKFILATDMDEAGLKARKKLRKELSNKLITEVFFPHNKKDANECTFDELENLVEVF